MRLDIPIARELAADANPAALTAIINAHIQQHWRDRTIVAPLTVSVTPHEPWGSDQLMLTIRDGDG